MELCLKKFDINRCPDNAVLLFIGKRGSGKSTCMKDILYRKRRIPSGICMSATESANSFWSDCIPGTYIFDDYDPRYVQGVIKRQKKIKKQTGRGSNSFIIFEDVIYDSKLNRDTTVREVFLNGRHFGLFVLFAMQYALLIGPALRSNVDYVFLFRETLLSNQERLFKQFGGLFKSFAMFQEVLNACTENYECLVLDQTQCTSNNIEDCVFWYKADIPPPFRAGNATYWQYHVLNARESSGEESDEEAMYKIRKIDQA